MSKKTYQTSLITGTVGCGYCRRRNADIRLTTREGSAKVDELLCLHCIHEFYPDEVTELVERTLHPVAIDDPVAVHSNRGTASPRAQTRL